MPVATDTVMGTDDVTTQPPSQQQRQETIQKLHKNWQVPIVPWRICT
jgi:hypothetical protein